MSATTVDLTPDWDALRKHEAVCMQRDVCPRCKLVRMARADVAEQITKLRTHQRGGLTAEQRAAIDNAKAEWGIK